MKLLLTNPVRVQKRYLHETLSPMNPATVGPSAGPTNGATVKTAKAFPRVSASQMSEIRALKVPHD